MPRRRRNSSSMDRPAGRNGIIVVDKPQDFTSFDVCAKLRGMLKTKRIGHAGTLDPMATGVMTVLLGTATRAAELLPVQDKRYIAGFRLGVVTDTLDITGSVICEKPVGASREDVENSLDGFRGDIMQVPPMYSALHVDGQRLYDLARKGVEVERQARPVTVSRLELLAYDENTHEGRLEVLCSKGTYIRTLVDDIGAALGCGAIMTSLRRTMAAGFTIDEAVTLDQLQQLCGSGCVDEYILPVESAFAAYARADVSPAQAVRYFNGGALDMARLHLDEPLTDGQLVRVFGEEQGFLGIGRADCDAKQLKPYKRFV